MRVPAAFLLAAVACGGPNPPRAAVAPSPSPAPSLAPSAAPSPARRATWTPLDGTFVAERLRVWQSSACAIGGDGRVACWGQVEYDDDSVAVERRQGMSTPHVLEGVGGVIDVARSWHYLCVAQRAGAGDGGCFVTIGLDRAAPVFPSPAVELQVADGGICAVMRDGRVGCVDHDGAYTDAGVRDLTALRCSGHACCGVSAAGAVACFGERTPALPRLPPATAVAFSGDEGCVRTRAGGAACWGDGAKPLARPSGVRDVAIVDHEPCVVLDDGGLACASGRVPAAEAKVVAADHACVRYRDGAVACTGTNDHGELGDGGVQLSPLPMLVPRVDEVVELDVAHAGVCVVRRDRTQWCWGNGQLPTALGVANGVRVPAQYLASCRATATAIRCEIPGYGGAWDRETIAAPKGVRSIKAAAMHRDASLCLVDAAGSVHCRHGMSEGGLDDRWVPLASPAPVADLAPLGVGFCARHTDGRASCFVDHRYDDDDDFLEALPTGQLELVPGIADATSLVAGQGVACVITRTAEVWCWDGDRRQPWQVTALTGATALGANHLHHCAVKDGEVWCWGDNFLGQLGTGAGGGRITPERAPVRAKTSFRAVSVGTGRDSTCALDDQGLVWCWGANTYGQLGQRRVHRAEGWSRVVGLGPR